MNVKEASDKQLKKELKELNFIINKIGSYGSKDLVLRMAIENELYRRRNDRY